MVSVSSNHLVIGGEKRKLHWCWERGRKCPILASLILGSSELHIQSLFKE